jgi:hypothetical protein
MLTLSETTPCLSWDCAIGTIDFGYQEGTSLGSVQLGLGLGLKNPNPFFKTQCFLYKAMSPMWY